MDSRTMKSSSDALNDICDFFGINKEEAGKASRITITLSPGELVTVSVETPAKFKDGE